MINICGFQDAIHLRELLYFLNYPSLTDDFIGFNHANSFKSIPAHYVD